MYMATTRPAVSVSELLTEQGETWWNDVGLLMEHLQRLSQAFACNKHFRASLRIYFRPRPIQHCLISAFLVSDLDASKLDRKPNETPWKRPSFRGGGDASASRLYRCRLQWRYSHTKAHAKRDNISGLRYVIKIPEISKMQMVWNEKWTWA